MSTPALLLTGAPGTRLKPVLPLFHALGALNASQPEAIDRLIRQTLAARGIPRQSLLAVPERASGRAEDPADPVPTLAPALAEALGRDRGQPRILADIELGRVLPLWRMGFEAPPRLVILVRPVREVIATLWHQTRMPVDLALILWATYLADAFAGSDGQPRAVLSLNDLRQDPVGTLAMLPEGWLPIRAEETADLLRRRAAGLPPSALPPAPEPEPLLLQIAQDLELRLQVSANGWLPALTEATSSLAERAAGLRRIAGLGMAAGMSAAASRLVQRGLKARAGALLGDLTGLNPVDPAPAMTLADLQLEAGRPRLAREALAELAAVDPEHPGISRIMARILVLEGDPEGAWAGLTAALEQHPQDQDLANELARLAQILGRMPQAAERLRSRWSQRPGLPPDLQTLFPA